MVLPSQSLAQRQAALKRANMIRSSRAAAKVALRADTFGTLTTELVANPTGREALALPAAGGYTGELPDDYALSWKIGGVLEATAKIGRVKARRILNHANVSPSKTLGGLSDRQRKALTLELLTRTATLNRKNATA